MSMHSHFKAAAIAIALSMPLAGQTAIIGIDFDSLPSNSYFANVETQGFRISPHCHVDINAGGVTGNFMGFDTSGCLSGNFNPNYLGPNALDSNVFIDYFNQPFDLLEFSHNGFPGFVRSSKGGYLEFGTSNAYAKMQPAGDSWVGISWIEIGGACGGMPCIRLDDIVFRVPEPNSAALALVATLVALAPKRRRTAQRLAAQATASATA